MKIVLLEADALGKDIDLSGLSRLGEAVVYPMTRQEEVAERIKDADIVIPNKVLMNESSMAGASKLQLIAEAATGYNNIDLDYCKERGIIVTNVRDYSSPTVAQHTLAMVLSLMEHLPYYDAYVKDGLYTAGTSFTHIDRQFFEVYGKRWGIIGLGNIGRQTARIAEAFGAEVVYYSASGRTYDVPYENVSLETLLSTSDIVTVHCPLTEKTTHMLDYDHFKMMKEACIFVNTARGPVIKEDDFVRAFKEGYPAMAGLDVFEKEPLPKTSPLWEILPNEERLMLTPHIGWGSFEARTRLFEDVLNSIDAFIAGAPRSTIC